MPCETSAADEATGQYGWVIAVSICTFANFVSNLGVNLQKLALQKRQDRQGPFYTLWIIGVSPLRPCAGPSRTVDTRSLGPRVRGYPRRLHWRFRGPRIRR